MRRFVLVSSVSLASFALAFPLALGEDAKEPDMDDLGGLEQLALKVEIEGILKDDLKRVRDDLSIDFVKEPPRPDGLVFPVKSSIKAEDEFTRKYYEKYDDVYDAVARTARAVAKENDLWKDPPPPKGKEKPKENLDDQLVWTKAFLKKYPDAKASRQKKPTAQEELHAVLARMVDHWEVVRGRLATLKAKKPDKEFNGKTLEKELTARAEKAQAFMKQYDFGPQIAKQRLEGSGKIYFDLTQVAYDYCRENMHLVAAKQLADTKGHLMKWRGKQVYAAPKSKLSALGVKKALADNLAEHEYFVIQYALADLSIGEEAREKALLRLTGAQLMFGTYYFIEGSDRIIVYVPDPPE